MELDQNWPGPALPTALVLIVTPWRKRIRCRRERS